jgi:hypothetical protein
LESLTKGETMRLSALDIVLEKSRVVPMEQLVNMPIERLVEDAKQIEKYILGYDTSTPEQE